MIVRPGLLKTPDGKGSAGAPPPSPPLDLIAAATAAYGLRKLRSAYAGKAVNIRRSSDNATQDIGFAGNDFDVAGFNAFVGGGQGFATIWYDQSGNGHDVSDAGFTHQPQLVLAATPTGRSALASVSVSGLGSPIPAVTIPFTLAAVAMRTGGLTTYCNILAFSGGTNPPALFYLNSPGVAIGNVGLDAITAITTDNQFHSVIGVMNGASSSLVVDRATTNGTLSNQPGSTLIYVPTYSAVIGQTCEAIYFAGVLSAGDIATLAANQRGYWGTP